MGIRKMNHGLYGPFLAGAGPIRLRLQNFADHHHESWHYRPNPSHFALHPAICRFSGLVSGHATFTWVSLWRWLHHSLGFPIAPPSPPRGSPVHPRAPQSPPEPPMAPPNLREKNRISGKTKQQTTTKSFKTHEKLTIVFQPHRPPRFRVVGGGDAGD